MIGTMAKVLGLCSFAVLVACGEKPQAMQSYKGDVAAYQGAENAFVSPGWKVGEKAGWEQALKARLQNTQNEYTKLTTAK